MSETTRVSECGVSLKPLARGVQLSCLYSKTPSETGSCSSTHLQSLRSAKASLVLALFGLALLLFSGFVLWKAVVTFVLALLAISSFWYSEMLLLCNTASHGSRIWSFRKRPSDLSRLIAVPSLHVSHASLGQGGRTQEPQILRFKLKTSGRCWPHLGISRNLVLTSSFHGRDSPPQIQHFVTGQMGIICNPLDFE